MNTKEMPARDRREDRSLRQEKLGQPAETFPAKNLLDREPRSRNKTRRPDKKHAPRPVAQSAETAATVSEVAFHLDAPNAAQVFVAGCFNDWNPSITPLRQNSGGSWSARVSLPPGVYQYRFIVDGEWHDDPTAPNYAENPFGTKNAVISVQ